MSAKRPLRAKAHRGSGDLDGRSALVTGGGRGIGAATAAALARRGARLGLAARDRAEVEEVAARIVELCSAGDANNGEALVIDGRGAESAQG